MNLQIRNSVAGGPEFFVVITIVFALVSSLFWMVVGWRAMRAHETIADVCENWLIVRRQERNVATSRESPKPPIAQPVVTEADFTPHKDAPPEYPWSKEI
ncbi:MAG: hypothetical protein NT013_15295 [Planctomycetia bacterium]|nr:hypothetical protein [Planctomycetia bacterium]